MTKPGLSVEHHGEIGSLLRQIQRELTHLTVEVGNAYPLSNKFSLAIRRAEEALREARNQGDSQLAREHPEQFDASMYFGS